ncbi:MAG: hypothetical protein ACNI27_00910 [Desulfovibrio sp.]
MQLDNLELSLLKHITSEREKCKWLFLERNTRSPKSIQALKERIRADAYKPDTQKAAVMLLLEYVREQSGHKLDN